MTTTAHGHHHPSHHNHNGNSAPVGQPAELSNPAKDRASDEACTRMIEVRAYHLWEQAGKPDGVSARDHFWTEAEKTVVTPHASGK